MGVFNPSVDSSKLSAMSAVSAADDDSGGSGNSENELMDENGSLNRPPTPAVGSNVKGPVKIQTSSLHSRPKFIGPIFPASNGLGDNHIRRSSLGSEMDEDDSGNSSVVSLGVSSSECDSGRERTHSSASSEHSKLVHHNNSNKNGIISQDKNGSSNGWLKSGGPAVDSKQNGVIAQLPKPKVVLYDKKKLTSGWKFRTVGSGLINLGNTCYMNASLQVLMHTTPFVNWLMDELKASGHKSTCANGNSSCTICPMMSLVVSLFAPSGNTPTKPSEIHDKLNAIGRNFSYGRQEDSHEFLRLLLESMERSYIQWSKYSRLDNRSKETTPIGQIFGGYTRSEVRCLKCHQTSTTFHPHAELQLDIRDANDVEEAIKYYFLEEKLDNADYKCEFCKCVRPATKKQFMEVAPMVLCIQLKRFLASGGKIKKPVFVNEWLDLTRYMYSKSDQKPAQTEYRLVGVVTHIGPTPNFGHYTAIARAYDDRYHHFDDSHVRTTSLNAVQNADAYVLMYESVNPSYNASSNSSQGGTKSSSVSATFTSATSQPSSATTTSNADIENGNANATGQELKFAAKPSTVTSLPEEACTTAAKYTSAAGKPPLQEFKFSNVVNHIKKSHTFQYNADKKPSKLVFSAVPPKINSTGTTFLSAMNVKREKSAENIPSQPPPSVSTKPLVPYGSDDENDSEEESAKKVQNENQSPIINSGEPLEAGEAPENIHQPTVGEARSTTAAPPEDIRKRENDSNVNNDQPSPKAAKIEAKASEETSNEDLSQDAATLEGAAHSTANNTS